MSLSACQAVSRSPFAVDKVPWINLRTLRSTAASTFSVLWIIRRRFAPPQVAACARAAERQQERGAENKPGVHGAAL